MMKKPIALLIILCIVFTYFSTAYAADYTVIHTKNSETTLAKGVTLNSIRQFTTKGWLNISVMKVDLSQNHIDVDALYDQNGIRNNNNLLKISTNQNIIGAVNADYFSKIAKPVPISWPVGTVIKNGAIVSAQSYTEDKFATLGVTKNKLPFYTYWNSDIKVIAPNGTSAGIGLVNKYYSDYNLNSIIMYDKNWDGLSVGSDGLYKGIIEVVVDNSRVIEIRKDMPGTTIPKNGFILAAVSQNNSFLDENFKIGDFVNISTLTNPDFSSIQTAVSGGTLLLKDGQPHNITWKHYGKIPITAVGTDASNKYMYLVTVDGRQSISGGMTQSEMAEFMKNLGCYNAIEMDGGGSTTMIARLPGEETLSVINSPSDGGLRNISTGLGIVNNAPKTNLSAIIVEPLDTNVFVNTSLPLTVKGYDSNYNPVAIDVSKVKWAVSGIDGSFKNNVFYPSSVGSGTVTATYNGVSGSSDIYSLSAPVELIMTPSKFYGSTGQSFDVKIQGLNKNGYVAPISTNDITWLVQNNAASIKDEKLTISSPDGGIIKASVGDVHAYAVVSSSNKKVTDAFETLNGTFIGYPAQVAGSYNLSTSTIKNGKSAGQLTFDFSADIAASKAAYLKLNTGIPISKDVSKIGVWVYSQPTYSHWLRAQLTDANGNIFRLNLAGNMEWDGWKYVEADVPATAAFPLTLDRLYIAQTDQTIKGTGTVYFDDLTLVVKDSGDAVQLPENTKYADPLNTAPTLSSDSKPFRVMVFGNTIQSRTLLDNILMKKMINAANNNSDAAVFLGFNDASTLSGLKVPSMITNGFNSKALDNNLFITLDSSKRTLREPDETQWLKLKNQISSIKSDNVFILMPSPLDGENGFTDPMEANLLKDVLTEEIVQKQNKNVFFLYNGGKNNANIYRGVRYLSTKGIQEITAQNIAQKADDIQYILITVDGKNVTYEVKSLFE
ncbi:phosphodiester glycosidase family protein [Petroclostridium sp. X23]|uniref:phosphodiester glycosidase family protein n=1 Tax=Petroclostridium sp. X23 TaxID=3045146 RepID=UPI0024ADE865|nr:phosphodiester glycosidase family protein [Petroclostridium sp. X23]WHH58384.1 phosphodiester glycosidase family protein [Petroclostridium sp. X23]